MSWASTPPRSWQKAITAWMGRTRTVGQATALGFAVERHALAAACSHLARGALLEHALNHCGNDGRLQPRQEARNGGLVRDGVALKAQSASRRDLSALLRSLQAGNGGRRGKASAARGAD
jgi:hypothetical protein